MVIVVQNSKEGKLAEWILELHQKYGDIVCLRMAAITMVFFKDGDVVKREFAGENFQEKALHMPFMRILIQNKPAGTYSSCASHM